MLKKPYGGLKKFFRETAIPPYYVPGPAHLTTLLQIFGPLFEHVKKRINVSELKEDGLPSVLKVSLYLSL